MDNGKMGHVVQALNMLSGEKRPLLMDPQLIEDQDMAAIERVLKEVVPLAPKDVTIYLQISEKHLRKAAKRAFFAKEP